MSTTRRSRLVTEWLRLFPLAPDEAVVHALSQILASYNQPRRRYHGQDHIESMLRACRRYFRDADPELIAAIILHDVDEDEDRSAEIAVELMLDLGASQESAAEVGRLILDTKGHRPTTLNGQRLCDLDLAGLGRPAKQYRANTRRIREEYARYSDDEWAAGRRRFIMSMLDREHIYSLPRFRERYERQARRNLYNELQHLPHVEQLAVAA